MVNRSTIVALCICSLSCADEESTSVPCCIPAHPIDMTVYLSSVEALCTGTFDGTVSIDSGCLYDSENFQLSVAKASETVCLMKDGEEAACSNAEWAQFDLSGQLEIGTQTLATTGTVVAYTTGSDDPFVECWYDLALDDDLREQEFASYPSILSSGGDIAEFRWHRIFEAPNPEPQEQCFLPVSQHDP